MTQLLQTQTDIRLHLDGERGWGIGSLAFNVARLVESVAPVESREITSKHEESQQAELVREVFGNPYRTINVNPVWFSPDVKTLADEIYLRQTFQLLPKLADALVAAGCNDEGIIDHCLSKGPHVRGCWAVDLLLNKT